MCHIRPLRGLGFSPKIRYPPSPNGDIPFQRKGAVNCGEAATTTLGPGPVKPENPKNLRAEGPSTFTPKGETTHYDLCVALLLQIMFAVHAEGVSMKPPPPPSAATPLSNLRTLRARRARPFTIPMRGQGASRRRCRRGRCSISRPYPLLHGQLWKDF